MQTVSTKKAAQNTCVHKRGKVSKIEYGNVDFEKVIIETVTSTQR